MPLATASVALKSDGTLWAWGNNAQNQLGTGGSPSFRTVPGQAGSLNDFLLLATGHTHVITASSTGVVRTWGTGQYGRLGDGTTTAMSAPPDISDAAYVWKAGRPTFSDFPGSPYDDEQAVTITSATPGVDIHYTLDGNEPTDSDPLYTGPVTVDESLTLKARAYKTGYGVSHVGSKVYTLTVAIPPLSPGPNSSNSPFTSAQSITITTETPGATIRYTTNNTVPTASSPLYTGPLAVDTRTTLRVAGFRGGWTTGTTGARDYYLFYGTLPPPTASNSGGTYTSSVLVALTATAPGATIRYTVSTTATPPADPTSNTGTVYSVPLELTATTILKARAFSPDYTNGQSTVFSATYTISAARVRTEDSVDEHPEAAPPDRTFRP